MDTATSNPPKASPDIGRIIAAQNFNLAIMAGIGTAIVGAVAWAVVTVTTKMELGLMAILIGFLVGRAIRAAGQGIERKFAYLGAVCALLGCVAGNILSDIAFYADARGLGLGQALAGMDGNLLATIVSVTFQPMDLLFYAIAVYEGFKFSPKYRLTVKPVAQASS